LLSRWIDVSNQQISVDWDYNNQSLFRMWDGTILPKFSHFQDNRKCEHLWSKVLSGIGKNSKKSSEEQGMSMYFAWIIIMMILRLRILTNEWGPGWLTELGSWIT
jgi:hypothetical protein